MSTKRVCVIGAGAAGLIAIRHIRDDPDLEGCVFEQGDSIGGVWNYTDDTGMDKYGIPIHSTAYKGLRTNLPKEIMGFLDYPFPKSDHSYINHTEVLEYFKTFMSHHKLADLIHFNTRVVSVEPVLDNNDDSHFAWNVQTEDLKTKDISNHFFDAVMVCNGHYTKPNIPEIVDLDHFKGEIWHSRDYRKPETFTGKRVVVLGGGPSAIDISIELLQTAAQVVLSCKSCVYTMPPGITICSPVQTAKICSFITKTGEEIECDAILFCSGFVYDFPFISQNCGISVEKGKYIFPLYRHLINTNRPSMAVLGVAFSVCPFPQFDIQARYFLKTLKAEILLPSKEEMIREIKGEEQSRHNRNIPFHHGHKLGQAQWDYNKILASDAGFSELILPVVEMVYNRAGDRRGKDPANYKHDYVCIIDKDNFEYIENYYVKIDGEKEIDGKTS